MGNYMTKARTPHAPNARTIAEQIAVLCVGATAYSLTYGYALVGLYPYHALQRKAFPPNTPTKERRNKDGRVTYSEHLYADGSRLVFHWSSATGSRLDLFAKGKA